MNFICFIISSTTPMPIASQSVAGNINSDILITILSILGSGILSSIIAVAMSIYHQRAYDRRQLKLQVLSNFIGYRNTIMTNSTSSGSSCEFYAAKSKIFIAFNKSKSVVALDKNLTLIFDNTDFEGNKKQYSNDEKEHAMNLLIKAMCDDLHIGYSDCVVEKIFYTPNRT